MKKSTFLISIIFLLVSFTYVFGAQQANQPKTIPGESVDQSYYASTDSPAYLISSNPNIMQTFKPQKPQLTRVEFYLKDRKIDSELKLSIYKLNNNNEKTGKAVVEASKRLPNQEISAWDYFEMPYPYPFMEINANYGITLSINDNQTRWYYSLNQTDAQGYKDGSFMAENFKLYADAAFRTYGRSFKDIPKPSGANSGFLVSQKQPPQFIIPATYDLSVPTPEIDYFKINDKKIKGVQAGIINNGIQVRPAIIDYIRFLTTDNIQVVSKSLTNNQLYLFNGARAFIVNPKTGLNILEVKGDSFESGDVWGQMVTKEGKGSQIIYLFSIEVNKPKKEKTSFNIQLPKLLGFILILGIIIMVGFGALILLKKKTLVNVEEISAPHKINDMPKVEHVNEGPVKPTGFEITPENINDQAKK